MMKTSTLAGVIAVPLVISIGQILFKRSSETLSSPGGAVSGLIGSPHFWIALVMYGLATVAWVFVIQIGRAHV